MAINEEQLVQYMESGLPVRLIDMEGQEYIGCCWYYNQETSRNELNVDEACVDIGSQSRLRLSEIRHIEYL